MQVDDGDGLVDSETVAIRPPPDRPFERHAFPRIGSRPVSEVTSADVLEVLTPIWHLKVQTAWCGRASTSAR